MKLKAPLCDCEPVANAADTRHNLVQVVTSSAAAVDVAGEDAVFIVEPMIHAKGSGVRILRRASGEIVNAANIVHRRAVRIGIKRNTFCILGSSGRPSALLGEAGLARLICCAVVVEIAGLESGGGNDGRIRQGGAETVPLGVDEKEGLVLYDRAAEAGAELIANERILRVGSGIEVIAGGHRIHAIELVSRAVKLVGAAPGDDIHDGARLTAEFGQKVVGDDAKFLSGIRIDALRRPECREPRRRCCRRRRAGNCCFARAGR